MLQRLWKPWYVWRPQQLLRRTLSGAPVKSGYVPLPVAWGGSVIADPTKTIGHSIRTTGIYELAVTEMLARIVRPGDTVIDAGANVGYMSVLAACATGRSGRVISFEPHPELFSVLQRNTAPFAHHASGARVAVHNVALGEFAGTAQLVLPDEFAENDGVARIARDGESSAHTVDVRVETLDAVIGALDVRIMKLDVEGFELSVLRGAAGSLRARRIRNVLFEEHQGPESDVARFLDSLGYTLFAIGWTVGGLRVVPISSGRVAASYEPQNYLATCEPADVLDRVARRGWVTLRRQFWRAATA